MNTAALRALPTISVILCVDRQSSFLKPAIDSILDQSDQTFEFLIAVNGGSTELLAELQEIASTTPLITIYQTKIRQLAFNLNYLADRAVGEFLVRMDADDISEKDRIEVLRRELAARPVDVLGSWCRVMNEAGELGSELRSPIGHDDIVRSFPIRNVIVHPSVAIRRSMLIELRGYLGGLHSEDSELWLRAIRHGARFGNVPAFLLQYRVHSNQVSAPGHGYREMAGHWLRDLLTFKDVFAAKGFSVAMAKAIRHGFFQ